MEYTPRELREMGDDEARQTLTVTQYERRENLLELMEEAQENEQRLQEQNQQVQDIVVNADMEQLGTEVDLLGMMCWCISTVGTGSFGRQLRHSKTWRG